MPQLANWYHAVSKDMLHWTHLPVALTPANNTYDCGGIFSGSATLVGHAGPVLSYSVPCNQAIAVAVPSAPSAIDPLLTNWTKPAYNPIIRHHQNWNFRDPTTAWKPDGEPEWRMVVGCSAHMCVLRSKDFVTWRDGGIMYQVAGDHMRECPDAFEIPLDHSRAADVTDRREQLQPAPRNGSLWAMKASSAPFDQYVIGKYNAGTNDSFVRVAGSLDFGYSSGAIGNGQLLDSGNMYAGKTFWDVRKGRRVLWGWVHEEPGAPPAQQWEGIMAIPRTVALDPRNGSKLVFMPIEEVAALRRTDSASASSPGTAPLHLAEAEVCSGCEVKIGRGNQVDVLVTAMLQSDGTANFTLAVLVNTNTNLPQEREGVNISITVSAAGSRSIKRMDGHVLVNSSSGETYAPGMPSAANFSVYNDERAVTVRVLVDRSIVETFVHEGRAVVTRRAYIANTTTTTTTTIGNIASTSASQNGVVVVNHHANSLTINSTVYQMASATDSAVSADVLRAEALVMMTPTP